MNTINGSSAPAYAVTLDVVNGKEMLVCDCGAKAFPSEYKRFNKRHPSLCSARKAFSKQLAQGTRCVDAEESDARIGNSDWRSLSDSDITEYANRRRERWDAIERALGGEPR